MAKNPILKYTSNFNGKLLCKVHTTIRLRNDHIYFKGARFEETLNNTFMGNVIVVDIKRIKIDQINDWVAGLDTGYLAAPCQEMIKTMYKNKVTDWEKQELHFMLLQRIDK